MEHSRAWGVMGLSADQGRKFGREVVKGRGRGEGSQREKREPI